MEIQQIKEILRQAAQLGIAEFSLSQREWHLSFKMERPSLAPSVEKVPVKERGERKSEENALGEEKVYFYSPMVGTFFRAPSPKDSPFVKEGDSVREGEVICIIEAMKVMNEITAECSGKILSICLENGEAVEFGTPLFEIEPLA